MKNKQLGGTKFNEKKIEKAINKTKNKQAEIKNSKVK